MPTLTGCGVRERFIFIYTPEKAMRGFCCKSVNRCEVKDALECAVLVFSGTFQSNDGAYIELGENDVHDLWRRNIRAHVGRFRLYALRHRDGAKLLFFPNTPRLVCK